MPSDLAGRLVDLYASRSLTLVLAESCTAGLVSSSIAEIPGASKIFWGTYVCYTPGAKKTMLGVGDGILGAYGAVSRETAEAMAEGALARSGADVALAVTGLAGPEGDGSSVSLGTVWISVSSRCGFRSADQFFFPGDRNAVRAASTEACLRVALRIIT